MSWRAVIFVEGEDDKQFISSYLQSLNYAVATDENNEEDSKILIYCIGGSIQTGEKIFEKEQLINKKIKENNNALFLLDADNNFKEKKEIFDDSYNKMLKELMRKKPSDTTAINLFLMPDNKQAGNLETILRGISVNKDIYDCIDASKECLTKKGYKKAPDAKGEIHDYCLANGIKSKRGERNYQDTNFWNLKASELNPLKDFLTTHL